MKVLVIGGGGREHAIAHTFRQSRQVEEVFVSPGNCGMEPEIHCVPLNNTEDIIKFIQSENIGLTFIGPEKPLAEGIVDKLEQKEIAVIGPTRKAAQIESSKVFAKNLMRKYHIPTADFQTFDKIKPALQYVRTKEFPLVVKSDGLAGGKGAFICTHYTEAELLLNHLMHFDLLGNAGHRVVIEDFLQGEEVSVFAFCDGSDFVSTILSQDHKQLLDGDKGPNTGGMGAYAPAVFAEDLKDKIDKKIIAPVLEALAKEGAPFKGILYAGLMVTKDGAKVLEFNCRLGDPEAQAVLPLLETDLADVCMAMIQKNITSVSLKWKSQSAVAVVLASNGYPHQYEKGKEIHGIENVLDDVILFFSGVKCKNGQYLTDGGRVLSVAALGNSLHQAREKAYNNVSKISFDGMYFRTDIAMKGIKKLEQLNKQ
ncbi:MAG: phosphoribosylamine--glycine ligase [Candidatus Cloacimonadia bacterium]